MFKVIDTFSRYKGTFQNNLDVSIDEKIKLWQENYINHYPALKQICINNYEDNNYNWKEIAKTKVFNRTKKDFSKMIVAHNNIIKVLNKIKINIQEVFFTDELDIIIVLYCGLCNSAGKVTQLRNKKAILFGLDKIAELNWHSNDKIKGLVSHELCHIIHFKIRGDDSLSERYNNNNYYKGIWKLYVEGFAQYFQHKLLGEYVYSRGDNWLKKCNNEEKKLKQIYYERLHNGEVTDFFGDWFSVLEISDTGYYLGEKFISMLTENHKMEEIARLDIKTIEDKLIDFLIS